MMAQPRVIAFWFCFAAAMAIYVVMVAWSLPKISAAAGGLIPFDMRPMGYSLADAQAFASALSEDGRAFYLSTQHGLDTVYPPLLALALGLALWIVWPPSAQALRIPAMLLPLVAMIADLVENRHVAALLATPAAVLDEDVVARASMATVLKSVLTTAAMTLLLVLLLHRGWRRWRRT